MEYWKCGNHVCEALRPYETMKFCAAGVKQNLAFIVLVLFLLSCAASQDTESTTITVNAADYGSYLKMVEKKVRSTWKYPTGVFGSQTVTLRFLLDIEGKLVNAEVTDSTDDRLSKSALEAIKRASPFPSIPENLKRLAGEPLVIKFAVSTKPK